MTQNKDRASRGVTQSDEDHAVFMNNARDSHEKAMTALVGMRDDTVAFFTYVDHLLDQIERMLDAPERKL